MPGFFSSPALAEEEEIYFQSDYQQEVQDEEVLLLQGNVEVHFREAIIYADEVRLNDAKDEFFGVGNVRYTSADRDVFADSIWYKYSTDEFDMLNARGSVIAQGVSEVVWFEAEHLKGDVNDFKLINGTVTTCSPDERREYHIEAHSIKVLPENKVIIRNGYFFILNVPILWFPFWAYSVAETPWVIKAGKNFNDVFVTTRYNYLAEELIIGTLLLDYYSRTGWTIGAEHSYVLPNHGAGNTNWDFTYGTYRNTQDGSVTHANTYHVTTRQNFRFGSRVSGSVSFNANSSVNTVGDRTNNAAGQFSTSFSGPNENTSLNLNLSETTGLTERSNISAQLTHNRTIFENVNTNLTLDFQRAKRTEGLAADEEFLTKLKFTQNRTGWNWDATFDTRWDPDGFTNITDRNKRYTIMLPEINMHFQQSAFPNLYRNFLGFQMNQLNLIGALYYIGPERDEINGFYGSVDTSFTRNDELGAAHDLQTQLNYWQAISSTGDARYVYSTSVNWSWDLSTKLKWQLGWSRSDTEGRIPFQGKDNPQSPSNRLNWNLNYTNGTLYTIRLGTNYELREQYADAPGHVLQIRRLRPLTLNISYTPNRKITVSLNTQYDFNARQRKLGDIRTSLTMTDARSFRLQTTLNFRPPGTFTQFSNQATILLGPNWDLELSTEFVPSASNDLIRDVKLTHRMDCTFFIFQYRAFRNEFFVTWGISAYPQGNLSYSTTERAFGPDFFNTFSGSGSGFGTGGFNFGNTGGFY